MAIHCVNHKSHSVIDLASELGINSLVAATKIALWQEQNGLENFPTAEELNSMEKELEEADVDDLIEEEDDVDEVINFANLQNSEIDTFDQENEVFYDVDENVFRNSLFDANADHISVDQILSNISNGIPDLTPHAKELAEKSIKLFGNSKAKVVMVDEDVMKTSNTVMQYDPATKEIQVSLERLKNFSDKDVAVAFLHEVVHSITADAIARDPKKRTLAEKDLVEVVEKFMDKYKNTEVAEEYGFTNSSEFVAEFYANPDFREAVKATSQGLWNKLISALRRFFNMPLNDEYTQLFDTITDFTENTVQDENDFSIKYEGVYAKEAPFVKPELTKFEDRLDYTIREIKDRVVAARARTAKTRKTKTAKERRDHLKAIDALVAEIEKLSEKEQYKVILEYAKTLNATVFKVDASAKRLRDITKNYRTEDLISRINNLEEYLSAYDIIKDVNKLIADSRIHKDISEEDRAIIDEASALIDYSAGARDRLLEDFNVIRNEQAIKVLSDPKHNTQVETNHRDRLYKEYNEKGITGESKIEYASRMLDTRDKAEFQADLVKAAEEIVYNPTFDITEFSKNWEDPLNTNSKMIQIFTQMFSAARDTIVSTFKDYDLKMSKLHSKFIKEKGNGAPSEIYKNIYEKDADGNHYFKGTYKIEYLDLYTKEFKPMETELREKTDEFKALGIVVRSDMMKDDSFKELAGKVLAWKKTHMVSDSSDEGNIQWHPAPRYRNKPLTGVDAEMLKEAIAVARMGHKATGGSRSLIRKAGNAQFYKFPSITKPDIERLVEKDVKGVAKQKITNITKIKADDIGYSEAVNSKGEVVRGVKIHYRGDIDSTEQSLDVATMLRMEAFNVISFQEKSKVETNAIMLKDLVKNKEYLQKSKKTGLPLSNVWNKNQPVVTIKGENTQEYARIRGLMDRMVYDVFHEHGGRLGPADVNKVVGLVNGLAASTAMSLNIGSGVANLFNGFTQTFIDGLGGDVFKTSNLLKAEKIYTLELPRTLADLTSPTKKSFVNQMLQMFDVVGGFDPATQEYIRNTVTRVINDKKNLNGYNEIGEHMMNSVLTMAVLDSLKVMNSKNQFIDKEGNVVSEDKAASLLDMLKKDKDGKLIMDKKVAFTKHNLTTDYHKGGKTHINLLIKSKVFDLYGVYDNNFKNEISKTAMGKLIMMFKNFFLGGAAYRFTGIATSFKDKKDLTDDERFYNTARKEYTEGTYTTLVRFLKEGVLPVFKSYQLMHMKEVYNNLSEHEKANLKKATIEIMSTMVILPAIGALLAGAAGPDDDELWFLIYQLRRLESELAQYRNLNEASKVVSNPMAAIRLIQSGTSFVEQMISPFEEDSKGRNKLGRKFKKLVPIWSQFDRDWKQMHTILEQ